MNRINLITLGVKDVKKSLAFYRDGLGFSSSNTDEDPVIVFFNNNGTKLALYPLNELAQDIGDSALTISNKGFSGITLAFNAKSQNEVDQIFARIEEVGGKIVKKPQVVAWGGYSGYFQDLDGYYWEVAYADFWQFDQNDMLIIPD